MPANIADLAALDHEDGVRIGERRQSVGYDDNGSPLCNATQIIADDRLAIGVERARRLIEDEEPRVRHQRAGNGETLLLAAGEVLRILLQHGLEAARQPLDELVGACETRRLGDLLQGSVRLGGSNVLTHRAAEKEVVLQHHADTPAQVDKVDFAAIDPVNAHEALLNGIEALNEPRDGRLAGAAFADNSEDGTGGNGEGDAIERRRRIGRVSEGDIVKLNGAVERRAQSVAAAELLGPLVHDLAKHAYGKGDLLILVHHRHDLRRAVRRRDRPAC